MATVADGANRIATWGGIGIGAIVELVAFLARADGYTSNESLPADLLSGENPGLGQAPFSQATIKLTMGE